MKTISYVSYYAELENPENRVIALSAINKMNYICDVLINNGYNVQIISASITRNKERAFRGKTVKIKQGLTLKTFTTLPWKTPLQKVMSLLFSKIGLVFTLLKIKRNEKIIVYHSLGYMKIIEIMHKIKHFHLILEVEEIYSDVTGNKRERKKEIQFLQTADSYIFPTKLLDKTINPNKKPAVFIHGTYRVEEDRKSKNRQPGENTNVIHCVYSGTLDPRKGGEIAAATAFYLPTNYHIHILGFGSEKEISNIKSLVEKAKKMKCGSLSYDGVLSGENYIEFLQNCDIGLSTQDPDASFNDTSFPSKILSYLANGLRVVSIRIPAIEQSAVSEKMVYYDEQKPEQIANAIMSIDLNQKYESRELISQLAKDFENDLYGMLELK